MKAAIASEELRTSGDSFLSFEVDEGSLVDGADRAVTRTELLDGSVLVTDWGFAQGRKEIQLGVLLSNTNYELLREFQEDNLNSYLFFYKGSAYSVIIRSALRGGWHGLNLVANLKLSIVDKLNDDGVYP